MGRGGNDLSLQVILSAQTGSASAALKGFGSILGGLSGPAGIAGAALAGFGAISLAALAKSVQMAAEYQQSMNMVQALTGASQAQMSQYDAGLKALAIDSGVAPTKLSQGLYYVISAGYQGADALNMLSLATKDAVIGMTDSKVTANALTTVMQGFNEKTRDMTTVNGEMLRTVTLGKMSMQDYAGAISKVAVLHAQYHVTLEDTNATLATLTSSGYKSAAIAATGYSQLVGIMDGKTDLMAKRIHKLGLDFDETKFKQMTYSQQLSYLNQVMQGHSDQLQNVLGGSKQAASAFTTLETHSQMFASNLKALSDQQKNAAATQAAWNITQGGFTQTMNRLNAAFTVLEINIGTLFLPILTRLVAALIPVVASVANWILLLSSLSQMFSAKLTPAITVFSEAVSFVGYYFDRLLRQSIKNVTDEFDVLWGLLANPGQLNDTFRATSDWMLNVGTPVYTAYAHVVGDILGGSYQKLGHDALTALLALPTAALKVDESIAIMMRGLASGTLKMPAIQMPSLGGMPGGGFLAGLLGPVDSIVQGVQQAFGKIVSILHAILQPFVDEWNRVLGDLMPSFFQFAQWWQNTMAPLFAQMGDNAKGAKSPLKELLDTVGNLVIFVAKFGMIFIENVLPNFMQGVGFLLTLLQPMLDLFFNFTTWLATTGIDTIASFFNNFGGLIPPLVVLLGGLALAFAGLKIADLVSNVGQFFAKAREGDGILNTLADSVKNKVSGAFNDFLSNQAPSFKQFLDDTNQSASDAATSMISIGTSATEAATTVETVSPEMQASISEMGAKAGYAGTAVAGIGDAATTAQETVATQSALMETDFEAVGVAATVAAGDSGIGKIGTAVTTEAETVATETGTSGMTGAFAAIAGSAGIGAVLVAIPLIAQGVHDSTVSMLTDMVNQVTTQAKAAHDAVEQQLVNQAYVINATINGPFAGWTQAEINAYFNSNSANDPNAGGGGKGGGNTTGNYSNSGILGYSHHASGGIIPPGGFGYVAEPGTGGELVEGLAGGGARVYTGAQTRGMLGGSSGGGVMQVEKVEVHLHVSGKLTDAEINDMTDRVSKRLGKLWRGNANMQVTTSGSVRS